MRNGREYRKSSWEESYPSIDKKRCPDIGEDRPREVTIGEDS
jgi:hypothetical protein